MNEVDITILQFIHAMGGKVRVYRLHTPSDLMERLFALSDPPRRLECRMLPDGPEGAEFTITKIGRGIVEAIEAVAESDV
jgi:hypothetical protein